MVDNTFADHLLKGFKFHEDIVDNRRRREWEDKTQAREQSMWAQADMDRTRRMQREDVLRKRDDEKFAREEEERRLRGEFANSLVQRIDQEAQTPGTEVHTAVYGRGTPPGTQFKVVGLKDGPDGTRALEIQRTDPGGEPTVGVMTAGASRDPDAPVIALPPEDNAAIDAAYEDFVAERRRVDWFPEETAALPNNTVDWNIPGDPRSDTFVADAEDAKRGGAMVGPDGLPMTSPQTRGLTDRAATNIASGAPGWQRSAPNTPQLRPFDSLAAASTETAAPLANPGAEAPPLVPFDSLGGSGRYDKAPKGAQHTVSKSGGGENSSFAQRWQRKPRFIDPNEAQDKFWKSKNSGPLAPDKLFADAPPVPKTPEAREETVVAGMGDLSLKIDETKAVGRFERSAKSTVQNNTGIALDKNQLALLGRIYALNPNAVSLDMLTKAVETGRLGGKSDFELLQQQNEMAKTQLEMLKLEQQIVKENALALKASAELKGGATLTPEDRVKLEKSLGELHTQTRKLIADTADTLFGEESVKKNNLISSSMHKGLNATVTALYGEVDEVEKSQLIRKFLSSASGLGQVERFVRGRMDDEDNIANSFAALVVADQHSGDPREATKLAQEMQLYRENTQFTIPAHMTRSGKEETGSLRGADVETSASFYNTYLAMSVHAPTVFERAGPQRAANLAAYLVHTRGPEVVRNPALLKAELEKAERSLKGN